MSEFDFGNLGQKDQQKFGKKEIPQEGLSKDEVLKLIRKELDTVKREIDTRIDTRTSSSGKNIDTIVSNKIAELTNKFSKLKEEISQELVGGYKQSLGELWDEIYPTLLKMWGNRGRFGSKLAKLHMLIAREENDKALSE